MPIYKKVKCDYADTPDCIIRNGDAPSCADGTVDSDGNSICYWMCRHWPEFIRKIDGTKVPENLDDVPCER